MTSPVKRLIQRLQRLRKPKVQEQGQSKPPVPANRPQQAQQPIRATADTLSIDLVNNTDSSTVYAYITGQAIDNDNALFILKADGATAYYPTSPSKEGADLSDDASIPLGAPGSTKTVTIPHLAGARIWFCIDDKLTFLLNPGPALVTPSVTNNSDPNINKKWDFCEFTWNSAQLYANITYVDFVSVSVGLKLTNTAGATQSVTGMAEDGLDTVCSALTTQTSSDGAPWSSLIVKDSSGANLRALSPNNGAVTGNDFGTYFQDYVDRVWTKYASESLSVNTQASYGTVTGKITDNQFVFDTETFSQPSSADIFSCSTGPFANASGSQLRNAIIPRLAAAFNRSTLLVDTTTPATSVDEYYTDSITNHYSRIVHEANTDKRGYSFPYDDVAPDNGVDQSGSVFDGAPQVLTVYIGGSST
ncbi:glucanase b [Diplodia corticola]|uniref:Glucanase b n=1 Tax=Diplodia corticola TaxID=236234 RepID=A0A1J9S816_9PEZI|nr:glucanase b [Diplodia corticola]OJD35725.1 glucanase b [Diplodia corticola]